MSTSPTTLSIDLTSLEAAQTNILNSSTAMVKLLNTDLITRYMSAYNDYVANMQSGGVVPVERRTPPTPPNGWQLAAPTADGFVFYEMGTTPVCDPGPAVNYNGGITAPVKVPNTIDIGKNITGKWFSVGPLDTFPSGLVTPPQGDGHEYEKFSAVVGAGWYLQVD
jgi:hypothetical protein